MFTDRFPPKQGGLTLIELVMFIVIVSVGIVGILSVMNLTTQHSADPMIRKQAVAIAESLLEEIQLQPFTYCDPEDATASTASGPVLGVGGCTTTIQGLGAAGKSRYDDSIRFNNVGNYHGLSMTGIRDLTNTAISGLGAYNATVTIAQEAQGGVASTEVLRIDVRVTGPINTDVMLTGYRFRYAPRAVP